jgi:UDP-3-O-[3-hydroxymyristoyl] glucosamine N-acyltransferase
MTETTGVLAVFLGGALSGPSDRVIEGVAPLANATGLDLTYIDSPKRIASLKNCAAGAVLIPAACLEAARSITDAVLIAVPDPQAAFIRAMLHFRPLRPRAVIGISERAHVAASAQIGSGTNIWPGATVAARAIIGSGCDIHSGVVVGESCRIGDGVVLHPNCVLYPDVVIGDRSIVHANAVIGADGFGYRFEQGRFVRIPHTGTVIVESDVEIGACSTIDRAMVGATRIGQGTKIDNLVQIAHNCEIGRHNAFASQVGIAGSSKTGDYVRCGGQAGVCDHVTIGAKATLGAKSGVMGDVPPDTTYYGVPAGPDMEQLRIHLALRKLPEMREQVRAMAKMIKALEARLGDSQNKDAA